MIETRKIAQHALDRVEDVDLRVTRAVAGERDEPIVRAAGKLSELADQPPLILLSGAVIVAGAIARDQGMLRTGARMLAAHLIATGVKTALKRSIDRTRPDEALDHGYQLATGDSDAHELSSFPSGHTAGAVAVAQAVARDHRDLGLAARLAAAAVAAIQIPRCKHFVSDVAVGALIGWAAEQAAAGVVRAAERRLTRDS